jgi:hypothetical protein
MHRPPITRIPRRLAYGRTTGALVAASGLAALALLAAGCGGSRAPSVADLGTTTGTATSQALPQDPMAQAIRYAACMRAHGLSGYPDPTQFSENGHQGIRIEVPDLSSPQAQTAEKACKKLLPTGAGSSPNPTHDAKQEAHLLRFATCMRRHGVTNFPDPNGPASFPDSAIRQIPRNTTLYQRANKACLPLAAGAIQGP